MRQEGAQDVVKFAELDFHQLGRAGIRIPAATYSIPPASEALHAGANNQWAAEKALKDVKKGQPDFHVITRVRIEAVDDPEVIEHQGGTKVFELQNAGAD